jgi:cyclin D6
MDSKAFRLAISYVSLAATMKKTEFCLADFQVNQTNLHIFEYWAKLILILFFVHLLDGSFIFDIKTMERLEILILGALKWRMRSMAMGLATP